MIALTRSKGGVAYSTLPLFPELQEILLPYYKDRNMQQGSNNAKMERFSSIQPATETKS